MRNTAQKAMVTVRRRIQGTPARRRGSEGSGRTAGPRGEVAASSSEGAMQRWLGIAVRYHSARYLDQIVAFKTLAGPVGVDGLPALYVWEVTRSREPGGFGWVFTVWDVSGCGVRFLNCGSEGEAMRLYGLPVGEGLAAVAHAPGVRLHPGLSTAQQS